MGASEAQAPKILLLGEELVKNKLLLSNLSKYPNLRILTDFNSFNQLKKAEVKYIDLIVLEIADSSAEALDWVKQIKSQLPAIKIIVVNSGHSMEIIAKAFYYGANDFFRTPVDVNLLSERISSLLDMN